MPEVCEINRIEDLAALRPAWQSLLERTSEASFFHSLDWLEIYWRHFGAGRKLRVIVVFQGPAPLGILPLAVHPERTRIGRVGVLTYPLSDWASFYGPIGEDSYSTLAAGLAHVRRAPRDWDLLELRWVDPSAGQADAVERAMRDAGFRPCRSVWNRTAVIDLGGSWEDYLNGRPVKWRKNLRRSERLLARQGELRYVRYRPAGQWLGESDPRWDLYDACEEIARRSWQGSSVTGTTLSHESVRPFFREAHAAAARWGAIDLNLLLLGGRPVAFAYAYHFRGSLYGLRSGFDPEFSQAGPGNVLYARMIQDSFARGDRLFDLAVDYLDAKQAYLTRTVPILRYSHFPMASYKGQILRLKRSVQRVGAWAGSSGQGAVGNRGGRP
jgi:CelD/BcsL family acetyltransferase involved in cellulose biosynthesis